MREIKTHQVNECNSAITIHAEEKLGPGGAPHRYLVAWPDRRPIESEATHETLGIDFQNGPIKEVGTNGITHEALLAVLADRLEHFQKGPFANEHNAAALHHIYAAQSALKARTVERVERGVEGTHKV